MHCTKAPKAVEGLRTLLRVLGGFKASYFHYKNKSAIEIPDNAWTAANNACFQRLDMLLERCHDVLDLAQTLMQYQRLHELEVGGPRGRTLSTSSMQIYSDFLQSVDEVRNLDFDIMDLSHRSFDVAWFKFRKQSKLLDQRLAAVVCEGVNSVSTTSAAFKVLYCVHILFFLFTHINVLLFIVIIVMTYYYIQRYWMLLRVFWSDRF
jgi:dynein heavy chain, axonemal